MRHIHSTDSIPCSKIASTRRSLEQRRDAVREELRELSAAIDAGEAALDVAEGVSRALEVEARDGQYFCNRAQARPGIQRAGSTDAGQVHAATAASGPKRPLLRPGTGGRLGRTREQQHQSAGDPGLRSGEDPERALQDAGGSQSNLARELVRSRERQVDLRREAREIARALRTLDQREQSGGDCRK